MTTAPMPVSLPEGWTAREPEPGDLPRLVELRSADRHPYTGSGALADTVESEIAGLKSWTRRQLVALDAEGVVRGWVSVHDRAAGRTLVYLYVDRSAQVAAAVGAQVAAALYEWAEERACAIARMRGLPGTQLDASPFAEDEVQRGWLVAAGYEQVRSWLHMSRKVTPEEAGSLPAPRAGVTVRNVRLHDNGLPVAVDLRTVHQMLEESFADHFNSYRESFPEFLQRLREEPGHRWDRWWLALVDDRPAGALVGSASGPQGADAYVEYIGVNRLARGRGVAKALLYAVIADVAARGGDRVGLEVDADSPTGADGLYRSLGWQTDYVTESWHKEVSATAVEGRAG